MDRKLVSETAAQSPVSLEDEVDALQSGCERLISEGGEIGVLASEIKRISFEMTVLSRRVRDALEA